MLRKSSQTPPARLYPQADGVRYRINRSKIMASARPGVVSHVPHPEFWRMATCEEIQCPSYQNGWVTTLNMTPDQSPEELELNRVRYRYIKEQSGRDFYEDVDGFKIHLRFSAGQTCFGNHQIPIERSPNFLIMKARQSNLVEFDEFQDRFNETSYQLNQRRKAG